MARTSDREGATRQVRRSLGVAEARDASRGCLGQWLARREAQLVFEYIAKKFPNYGIGARERVLTATVRGYTRVEMTLR